MARSMIVFHLESVTRQRISNGTAAAEEEAVVVHKYSVSSSSNVWRFLLTTHFKSIRQHRWHAASPSFMSHRTLCLLHSVQARMRREILGKCVGPSRAPSSGTLGRGEGPCGDDADNTSSPASKRVRLLFMAETHPYPRGLGGERKRLRGEGWEWGKRGGRNGRGRIVLVGRYQRY